MLRTLVRRLGAQAAQGVRGYASEAAPKKSGVSHCSERLQQLGVSALPLYMASLAPAQRRDGAACVVLDGVLGWTPPRRAASCGSRRPGCWRQPVWLLLFCAANHGGVFHAGARLHTRRTREHQSQSWLTP